MNYGIRGKQNGKNYENEHKKMKETIRSLSVALSKSLNGLETDCDIHSLRSNLSSNSKPCYAVFKNSISLVTGKGFNSDRNVKINYDYRHPKKQS